MTARALQEKSRLENEIKEQELIIEKAESECNYKKQALTDLLYNEQEYFKLIDFEE